MAKATTPITLDVVEKKRIQVIVAKQYDTGARELKIRMTNKGVPIFVEKNCVVTINAFRENGGQSKAFGGTTNDDGTVTVPITFWMLEMEGEVNCDVSVYDESGNKLSTLSFDIEVEKANYEGGDISEDENYDLLITLLADVAEAKKAENERVQAENERVQAENEREKDLSQLIASVSKNSKRITNLEERISPELFTTDTDVAYSKDVPENALPYAEITEIGGMTYKDGDTLRSAPVSAVESVGANLLGCEDKTVTHKGITFSIKNCVVTANGTSSETYAEVVLADILGRVGTFYIQDYVDTGLAMRVQIYDANGNRTVYRNRSFTLDGTETRAVVVCNVDAANVTLQNATAKAMLNRGTTAKPYAPYVKRTLEIPEAVQALDGYGEGNPDDAEEYNAIICENGKWKYSYKGDIEDNLWTPLAEPIITDISGILPADNFIEVEGGGTVTMVNEHGYDVPSSITYQLDAEAT